MRRTASEILSDLEIRIAHLERQALYPSSQMDVAPNKKRRQRGPGRLSLVEMKKNARDLLRSARMLGFASASMSFDDDNPVIDLGTRQLIIYVDKVGYHLINFSSRGTTTMYHYDKVKVLLARKAYDLGLRDVPDASPLHEDAGTEEMGMDQVELTAEFNRVHGLLSYHGLFNERWRRMSDDTIVSGTGEYTLTLKQTPKNIKFTLTGPNLKRGQAVATIRGMVTGVDPSERFLNFAERMAKIETAVTKRQSRLQAQAIKALRAERS
jgi:hypothetical protein